jgi:hypothetical protein
VVANLHGLGGENEQEGNGGKGGEGGEHCEHTHYQCRHRANLSHECDTLLSRCANRFL